MSWVKVPHIKGKVYVPEKKRAALMKYPCPDCFACQQCSDERCNTCRSKDDTIGTFRTSTICCK